jgi:hypothetical protein
MAIHELDNGETIFKQTLNDNGEFVNTPITEESERFTFFENVVAKRMHFLRHERDQKLAETDWIVTKSLEQNTPIPQEWLTYRQSLRDITENYSSQDDVVWPVKPE